MAARATKRATATSAVNLNENLTKPLAEMGEIQRSRGDTFRASAYAKAVSALKRHPKKVESGVEARQIPGIGEGIAGRIQELLDKGKLQELEDFSGEERQTAIKQLMRVPGIGPAVAAQLYDAKGIRTLDDLRAIGPTLTHHQQVGLKYLDELELRVPRSEVAEIEGIVRREAAAVDPRFRVEAAGSYRRGLPESGDIDILATHPDYANVRQGKEGTDKLVDGLVSRLTQAGLVTDVVALGPVQFMGIVQLPGKPHRHLDIKLLPTESFPAALLHFTGSGSFNIQTREYAKERGFLLNEYGLYRLDEEGRKGEPVPAKAEEDIFAALGLPYKTPAERSL